MLRMMAIPVALAMAAPGAAQMGRGDAGPSPVPSVPMRGCATAAGKTTLASGDAIVLERPASAVLTEDATFPVAPGHTPAPGTFGGHFGFTVATAGRYRIGVTPGVWIDVVSDGKPVASVAHQHGPCKLVDFDLTAGRHILELSGSATPASDVMIVRA